MESKEMITSNYFQFTDKEPVVQGHYLAQGHRTSKPGLLNLNLVLFLYLTVSSKKDFRFLERPSTGERHWYSLFPLDSQHNVHFFQ